MVTSRLYVHPGVWVCSSVTFETVDRFVWKQAFDFHALYYIVYSSFII
jgi:hypothetical protein